jgi:hypothetical protein
VEWQGQDGKATAGEARMRGHCVQVLGILRHRLTIDRIQKRKPGTGSPDRNYIAGH